jgi:hypothetical protein
MKNSFYLLICFSLFIASLSSCSHSSSGIPFKHVSKDTASKMIKKYLKPEPTADTNFREVPKLLALDAKTLKTFTEKNKDGDVTEIRFILAAYLDSGLMTGLKNTILLQLKRTNNVYYYYDLRVQWDPVANTAVIGPKLNKDNSICPPPMDCIPPGLEN